MLTFNCNFRPSLTWASLLNIIQKTQYQAMSQTQTLSGSSSSNDRGHVHSRKVVDGHGGADYIGQEVHDGAGKGRWAWVRALLKAIRCLGSGRRRREEREYPQSAISSVPLRSPMTSPAESVTPSSPGGAYPQPSPSSSGDTWAHSPNPQVASHLPFPIQLASQAVAINADGHTSMFEGLSQAHVSGGTFYAGHTINIYLNSPYDGSVPHGLDLRTPALG